MEGGRAHVIQGRVADSNLFHANDGFYYTLRKMSNHMAHLRCRYHKRGCGGTACITLEDLHLHHYNEHKHTPDLLLPDELEMRRNIISDAEQNISGRGLRDILNEAKLRNSLHSDGTFKKRPRKPKSSQIFNLVTRYRTSVIAILRALMLKKTEAAYVTLLNYIMQIAPNLRPARIHCDFEKAQMNAWKRVFPNSRVAGCLWHYAVAFSRYARKVGLAPLAKENPMVLSWIRCMCAVPMLPANLIPDGVLGLWDEVVASGLSDRLEPLVEYFVREWLPRLPELSVFNLAERTNNCSESDNHSLSVVFPKNHPNVWRMIGGFVKLEYLAWSDKCAIDDGRPVSQGRKWSAVLNDASIRRHTALLQQRDITTVQFLHRSSWAIFAAVQHGLRLSDNQLGDSSGSEDSQSDSD